MRQRPCVVCENALSQWGRYRRDDLIPPPHTATCVLHCLTSTITYVCISPHTHSTHCLHTQYLHTHYLYTLTVYTLSIPAIDSIPIHSLPTQSIPSDSLPIHSQHNILHCSLKISCSTFYL